MEHSPRFRRPRVFNTAFESGVRSVVLLTASYPTKMTLRKLVVFDYLLVYTADVDGPSSLHPEENSRTAELLVRRGLIASGLSLMGTRGLVKRYATRDGFLYEAGEEAGTFVDLLRSPYALDLKTRAQWLAQNIVPLDDNELNELVRQRIDEWASEFQATSGP